ncbi:hypothetical protein BgiBS90_000402 [Biomphalaria glabrata]|nr:hypothetical protein BgiBS90_000402 [Biomphalaria glabrata]
MPSVCGARSFMLTVNQKTHVNFGMIPVFTAMSGHPHLSTLTFRRTKPINPMGWITSRGLLLQDRYRNIPLAYFIGSPNCHL